MRHSIQVQETEMRDLFSNSRKGLQPNYPFSISVRQIRWESDFCRFTKVKAGITIVLSRDK